VVVGGWIGRADESGSLNRQVRGITATFAARDQSERRPEESWESVSITSSSGAASEIRQPWHLVRVASEPPWCVQCNLHAFPTSGVGGVWWEYHASTLVSPLLTVPHCVGHDGRDWGLSCETHPTLCASFFGHASAPELASPFASRPASGRRSDASLP